MDRRLPTVVVGDLVGSRHVEHRRRASGRITRGLVAISEEIERDHGTAAFAAAPKLTKGIDELSAVLWRPEAAYRLCRRINNEVAPLRFRFAIVRGRVDVGLKSADAARMDGPAFHLAADGIGRARERDDLYVIRGMIDDRVDELLTVLANTVQAVYERLSDHQRRTVALYEEFGNQRVVARHMRITQQAVSDALRSAQYRRLTAATKVIDRILSTV